jgi:hypothetical protein
MNTGTHLFSLVKNSLCSLFAAAKVFFIPSQPFYFPDKKIILINLFLTLFLSLPQLPGCAA